MQNFYSQLNFDNFDKNKSENFEFGMNKFCLFYFLTRRRKLMELRVKDENTLTANRSFFPFKTPLSILSTPWYFARHFSK